MRRLINSTYITLDGVIEGPHLWPSPDQPRDERGEQIQTDLLLSCDALLMGRRTYEGFAPVCQAILDARVHLVDAPALDGFEAVEPTGNSCACWVRTDAVRRRCCASCWPARNCRMRA